MLTVCACSFCPEQADPICHTVTGIPVSSVGSGSAILNEVYSGVWLDSQNAFAVTDSDVS